MFKYIIKRILSMIPTLLLTSILIFLIIRLIPGDPAVATLGEMATEEKLIEIREQMGLNEPIHKQYLIWMKGVLKGDLGESIFQRRPVIEIVFERMETTLLLGALSSIIIIFIALPIGIIAASKANSWIDQIISGISMFFAAVPAFWLGLNLMLIFAVQLKIFPTSGFPSIIKTGDISNIRYLILPAFTVAIPNTSLIIRMTRSSMLDVIKEDYVRTARSKGLSLPVVYIKHVFRNSLISIVSSFGFILAALISGSVITENVFALPGLGQFLINSISLRDYPAVQGVILTIALIFMLINLLVDIAYAIIDPRIQYS